ncbi:MAG: hypothetical protein K8R87_00395, partial [Verrucomicrobia bacterium]|nr:hypothetical protein [Verrucomicrobiota bacterium]
MSAMATVYNNGTLTSGVLIQPTSDSNSYASYMPGGTVTNSGGISFATFNPHIEGNPGQVLDLFRMTPGGSGPGTFVGRFTLYSTGKLVFTPRDGIGAAFTSVQVEQPTYSVTENVGSLTVKIVRGGDPLVAFDVTADTANGTALASTDYTAQLNQLKSFAANDAEKSLVIPILPRAGAQSSRD